MSILFFDPMCPKPYDANTLLTEGMGGTEATVVRLAEKLSGKSSVSVMQHNRTDIVFHGAHYMGPAMRLLRVENVICLRDPSHLPALRAKYGNDARLFLWVHDLPNTELTAAYPILRDTRTTVVCVSQWQKTEVVRFLSMAGNLGQVPIKVIHNPIDDDLKPDSTPIDVNKLMWFSSPHKGLEGALGLFQLIRAGFLPDAELHIANPGYLQIKAPKIEGVKYLGALPHHEAVAQARSSLCVFYPNMVHPETFGLVFAEANAVGCPVLTHPLGAAYEVLDHPSQIVDCRDPKLLIDRLIAWHDGARPIVRGRPGFRLTKIAQAWDNLFRR